MNKLVEIKDINAGYDGKVAISNVNLTVHERDFLAFIGPNGGGKTTLAKTILGLLEPSAGTIRFFRNNQPVQNIKMGYMAQRQLTDQQFPIKVCEVVLSGLPNKGNYGLFLKRNNRKRMDEVLEMLNINHLKNAAVSDISGGEMQRVLLGRAIVSMPELLILDEPDTYLDTNSEEMLYSLLSDMNKHMAIIIVSHDIGVVSSVVKSIACVNQTVHYHPSNEITNDIMEHYQCPIELITHGKVPHRVLKSHLP
jgi:zinc transport system ATP-binding protein